MKIGLQASHARSAYLQGFIDRRKGRSFWDNEAGALQADYLSGWEDGERLVFRITGKPHPLPSWLIELVGEVA